MDVSQKEVAVKMEEVAAKEKVDFILNTGDNFYDPSEDSALEASGWERKWAQIYKGGRHLRDLTWYGVIGN